MKIVFDSDLVSDTVADGVILLDKNGKRVGGQSTYANRTVVITGLDLTPGADYKLVVLTTVQDVSGRSVHAEYDLMVVGPVAGEHAGTGARTRPHPDPVAVAVAFCLEQLQGPSGPAQGGDRSRMRDRPVERSFERFGERQPQHLHVLLVRLGAPRPIASDRLRQEHVRAARQERGAVHDTKRACTAPPRARSLRRARAWRNPVGLRRR